MGIKATPQEIDAFLAQQGAGPGTAIARTIVDRCTLILPWPLATGNNYKAPRIIAPRRGTPFISWYVKPKGVEYRRMVADAVFKAGSPYVAGHVAMRMVLHPPSRRAYDGDNAEKVIVDAVALAGVIDNDKYVELVSRRKMFVKPNGEVIVTFRRFGENYGALFQ